MRRFGFLTELQVRVIKLRSRGLSLREVAAILGTSHQNISVAERRARENVRAAEETIAAYKIATAAVKVVIEEGTHLADVPKIVMEECDRAGVRLRADFTLIFKMLKFSRPPCVEGQRLATPILVLVDREGYLSIYPLRGWVERLLKEIESI